MVHQLIFDFSPSEFTFLVTSQQKKKVMKSAVIFIFLLFGIYAQSDVEMNMMIKLLSNESEIGTEMYRFS